MQERRIYNREELVNQLIHCAQSVIDNADSIIGEEKYFTGVTVTFDVFRNINFIPQIEIKRRFTPELEIEDYRTYQEYKKKHATIEKINSDVVDEHIPHID